MGAGEENKKKVLLKQNHWSHRGKTMYKCTNPTKL